MSESWLPDWIAERADEIVGQLNRAVPLPDGMRFVYDSPDAAPQQFLVPEILAHQMTVSLDFAMDWGIIPDTRPPVKIKRRTRLRWKLQAGRVRAAELAYRLIAGEKVSEPDW